MAKSQYQAGALLQGLPTRAELLDRWQGIEAAAHKLSMLPDQQAGMLSHAVAALAYKLKVLPLGICLH